MKRIMVFMTTRQSLGGPTVAMRRLMDSYLKEKYSFIPYYFLDYVGFKPKLSVLKALVRDIKKNDPDVIYFSGMMITGFYTVFASLLAGKKKKTLMVVGGSSCDGIGVSGFNYFILKHLESLTVRMAEITHTVCTEMANNPIVMKNCKRFGGVIYNFAPLEVVENHTFSLCRKDLGLNEDDVVLIYTGRLTVDKGIQYLLDAIKLCDQNIRLLIVGDGRDKEKFVRQANDNGIADRARFLGYREDVLDILNCSDIFVFPTLHENLSISLLEACSMGLPVIATNLGGNPEVIRNNIDGILVKEGSAEALADAIKRLSDDKELREKMGHSAKERMKNVFSPEIILKKIDELFERI